VWRAWPSRPNLYARGARGVARAPRCGVEGEPWHDRFARLSDGALLRLAAPRLPGAAPDIIFPILNSSQNWFAEMLLKILAGAEGRRLVVCGLGVERGFLTDSVKIDSTAFALEDGSGLAAGNLVTPQAFAKLLAYMHRTEGGPFVRACPRGQPGSLLKRSWAPAEAV